MCADTLRVALVVPNVGAYTGGMERMMKLVEHSASAGIAFTAFLPDGRAPNPAVGAGLADLERSGRVGLEPLGPGRIDARSYDAVGIPTEYWWGPWKRARKAGLRGPTRIDCQLLPYIGSLDLLKTARIANPGLSDLVRLPFLQASRFSDGLAASAVQTAACIATVRGLRRFRENNVLAISPVVAKGLAAIGYRGPVAVPECPNGIDREPVEASLRPDVGLEFDAAFAARGHPQKGFLDLPIIVARLKERAGRLRVAVCGGADDPRYEVRFGRLASELGVRENLVRLGHVPRDELYLVLRRSRMLLYPSYVDSFSLTVLESLALGVPVVAYDTDAMATIWARRPGVFRSPVGNPDALAALAADLLADGRLDEARHAAIRASPGLLAEYTWARAAADERKFYEAGG